MPTVLQLCFGAVLLGAVMMFHRWRAHRAAQLSRRIEVDVRRWVKPANLRQRDAEAAATAAAWARLDAEQSPSGAIGALSDNEARRAKA